MKGYETFAKSIPGSHPEKHSNSSRQGRKKPGTKPSLLDQRQQGEVTNASPVVLQCQTSGELRLCLSLKVHINVQGHERRLASIFQNLHILSNIPNFNGAS